jgi:hypothetical protein
MANFGQLLNAKTIIPLLEKNPLEFWIHSIREQWNINYFKF